MLSRLALVCVLLALLACAPLRASGIILNEVSNGPAGSQEYYELMVVGDAASPLGAVNLDRWIVDDNNGDWGVGTTLGIAPGYTRFDTQTNPGTCSIFGAMAPGKIIVIYNQGDRNPNLPADDVSDSNSDGVYILPANSPCLRTCAGPPDATTKTYSACTTAAPPAYTQLGLRNGGDAMQTRTPAAALFHGYTFGDITTPYPSGSFSVSSASGAGTSYVFSCGDWHAQTNFAATPTSAETPGATNNALNLTFRQKISAGTFNYAVPSAASNCGILPNFTLLKSIQVLNDPYNGSTLPKAIPGAEILYSVQISNQGTGSSDTDSTWVTDVLPPQAVFFGGDLGTGAPVILLQGSPSSGTTFTFISLASTSDDIEFSNNGGASYSYVPVPDANGYDAAVNAVRIRLRGTFAASSSGSSPSATLRFKMKIP